jgi:5-methylcytosine-specific restriction endonuclease McrA
MDTRKTCSGCGATKPLTEYGKNSARSDGFETKCKSCKRQAHALWRAQNAERWKELKAAEKRRNRESYKESNRRRLERERLTAGNLPPFVKEILKHYYGPACMYPGCSRVDVQVDHVVPLALGGRDDVSNLQLLCPPHNNEKNNSARDYRNGRMLRIFVERTE